MERWDMPHSSSRLTLAMPRCVWPFWPRVLASNFQALVEALRDEPRLQVVLLIVNRPGCGAQKRAEQLGVPCQLIDHTRFDSRDSVDAAVVQALQNAAVELVVMAGWMRIVTPALISPSRADCSTFIPACCRLFAACMPSAKPSQLALAKPVAPCMKWLKTWMPAPFWANRSLPSKLVMMKRASQRASMPRSINCCQPL